MGRGSVCLSACGSDPAVPQAEEEDRRRAGTELTNAFLNLTFEAPVALSGAPAGLPRLYVALRSGYIHQFDNDLQVEGTFAFVDLRDRVLDDGEAGGLRSFVFHPDWATNGEIYVHYIAANPRRSVISRFLNEPGTLDFVDPASEEVLLEIDQPHGARPGGPLRFGPDGFLYIALGDGGPDGDPPRCRCYVRYAPVWDSTGQSARRQCGRTARGGLRVGLSRPLGPRVRSDDRPRLGHRSRRCASRRGQRRDGGRQLRLECHGSKHLVIIPLLQGSNPCRLLVWTVIARVS